MLDIKFVRENPELVKENIKKKFQDHKLPYVDEVIELDSERRQVIARADELRANRNKISKQIGALMAQGKKEEGMALKEQVTVQAKELDELAKKESELGERVTKLMMSIPNIIDESVPIGKDDSENVEVQRYGEPVVPDFEIPYHTDIMEKFDGIDMDAAGRVAGNGFYYLAFLDAAVLCDIAHKAVTLTCILYIVVKYTGNLAVKGHYTYVYLIGEYGRYLCVIWRYLAHHTYKSV